jgi:putative transposase
MPRKPRREQLGEAPVYHVVNRGILRQTIFHDRADCDQFMSVIRQYKQKEGFRLYHWCLMGNHYHLVLELPEPSRITKIVGGLQQVYAWHYHRRHGTAGKLFGSRFKSQVIDREAYLLACGRYVERNPVRAKLAENAWEWEQSSAKFYVLGQADAVTDRDQMWAGREGREYAEWLSEEASSETKLFRSAETVVSNKPKDGRNRIRDGRIVGPLRGRKCGNETAKRGN